MLDERSFKQGNEPRGAQLTARHDSGAHFGTAANSIHVHDAARRGKPSTEPTLSRPTMYGAANWYASNGCSRLDGCSETYGTPCTLVHTLMGSELIVLHIHVTLQTGTQCHAAGAVPTYMRYSRSNTFRMPQVVAEVAFRKQRQYERRSAPLLCHRASPGGRCVSLPRPSPAPLGTARRRAPP